MCSASILLVLIQVSVLMSIVRAHKHHVDCYPNNTMILMNPDPTTLHYGVASDSDDQCNMAFSSDYTRITLTGCSKNETIVVQLADKEVTGSIIGGTSKVHVSIMCKEIEQGMERNITNSLGSSLIMDDVASVDLSFQGSSSFRMTIDGEPITRASLSEIVLFTYDLYAGYVMRFLQCTAHPGQNTTTFDTSHKLIENDCSVDVSLIDSFAPHKTKTVDGHTRYATDMSMFRFWESLYMTISCDIMICRQDSSAQCTMTDCPNARRRRDTVDERVEDVQRFTTTSSIKVLDKPEYLLIHSDRSSARSINFISDVPSMWMLAGLMMML